MWQFESAKTPMKNVISLTGELDANEPTGDQAELESKSSALPKIIRFEELNPCGEEIWIENGGQIYRLRRTRQGKLILTK